MEKNTEKITIEQLPEAVSDILNRLDSLADKIEPFVQTAKLERPMCVEDCAALLTEIEGRERASSRGGGVQGGAGLGV